MVPKQFIVPLRGPYNKGDRILGYKLGFTYFGKVSCWVQGWVGPCYKAFCVQGLLSGLRVAVEGVGPF